MSAEAISVLARIPPIFLLAEERYPRRQSTTFKKGQIREDTIQMWQTQWSNTENSAWTRQLIEEIKPWVNRMRGAVDYYITQAFTGHDCFKSYLKRIGKTLDDKCWYCEENNDACHTVFYCERWNENRLQVAKIINQWLHKGNLVDVMIKREKKIRKK